MSGMVAFLGAMVRFLDIETLYPLPFARDGMGNVDIVNHQSHDGGGGSFAPWEGKESLSFFLRGDDLQSIRRD